MPYSKAVENSIRNFVRMYGAGIAESINNTNLFFPMVVAQSAFESGYGKRIPPNSNNFAGVKYNPNLKGVIGYVEVPTDEYINGKKVRILQKFSKFKDVKSGFDAHINVLLGNRYKEARDTAKTPEIQFLKVVQAGYSTAPAVEYLNKIKPLIEATRDVTGLGRIVGQVGSDIFNRV